jgi:hypothetical protein
MRSYDYLYRKSSLLQMAGKEFITHAASQRIRVKLSILRTLVVVYYQRFIDKLKIAFLERIFCQDAWIVFGSNDSALVRIQ